MGFVKLGRWYINTDNIERIYEEREETPYGDCSGNYSIDNYIVLEMVSGEEHKLYYKTEEQRNYMYKLLGLEPLEQY